MPSTLPVEPQRRARAPLCTRRLGLTVLAALCLPAIAVAQAGPYPSKPITLVVGNAPGGSNDIFARAIGRRLQEALGQPVVVDNKPAGGGVIANTFVAKAPPDGYALAIVSSTFTTGAAIRTNLSYDAVKSFKPVAMLAKGPLLVTVPANSPFKTIGELVAYAKAHPTQLNYGTSGAGSINHFATELFSDAADIKLTHVPYKGSAPALTDLIGGQVQLMFDNLPSSLQFIRTGKLRALAVTSAARSTALPELPTLAEAGLPGFEASSWFGILAPAGTPKDIVAKINAAVGSWLASPEAKEKLLAQGAIAAGGSPDAFVKHIDAETAKWAKVVKASGAHID